MIHCRYSRLIAIGSVAVTLVAGACHKPEEFSPSSPEVQDALKISLSASSLPADGVATLVITAQIDPRALPANRKLVFKAEDGAFLEATTEPFRQVERTVDVNGRATVTLRSSRNVRPVGISVEVMAKPTVFARATVNFVRADPGGTIAFIGTASSAPADGATLTPVTVEISAELPTGRRTVTFNTNRGTFAQGGTTTATATAGADNGARVDLKSAADAGPARLTATVDGVTIDHVVDFTQAFPDAIVVTPAKVRLQATTGEQGMTNVKVDLVRNVGTASRTALTVTVVQVSSNDNLPVLIGGLSPTNAGSATFTLTIGALPSTSLGFAEIQVRVPDSSVVGRATIEIVAATS